MSRIKLNWFIWFQGLLFVGASALVIRLVFSANQIFEHIHGFFQVLSPFILGGVLAYLLNAPCKLLEKHFLKMEKVPILAKRARGFSVLTLYVMLLMMIGLMAQLLFPIITQNIVDFIGVVPQFFVDVQQLNFDFPNWFNIEETIQLVFDAVSVQDLIGHLNVMANLAVSMTASLIDFFIAVIMSIYCLLYKKKVAATTNRILRVVMKEEKRHTLIQYVRQASDIFYKFIATQFLDACILGVLSMILLAILNVRFAVMFGFFLGICNMIPKFGSIFGSVIVILFAFATGGVTNGLVVAVLLTILQQIDGNVIGPKLMGDALDINPIVVFMALAIGGAYFGIMGMFLSIPVAVMLKIIFFEVLEFHERN